MKKEYEFDSLNEKYRNHVNNMIDQNGCCIGLGCYDCPLIAEKCSPDSLVLDKCKSYIRQLNQIKEQK